MPDRKRTIARTRHPSALTIAGSDSGGGAGIQADLKVFGSLHVHGTSAITCITAQNPRKVIAVQPVKPEILEAQIEAVWSELPPAAVKTGMLYSAPLIRVVASALSWAKVPLIVDPVMVATSGALLLKPNAVTVLKEKLLPLASLVTPNLSELEFLLDRRIRTPEQLRGAARDLHALYGCAVLAKGGHLPGPTALDFYFDSKTELLLESPKISGISTHGTGCTLSAAVAAWCAIGRNLPDAAIAAKSFVTRAIAASYRCGSHSVLNPLW